MVPKAAVVVLCFSMVAYAAALGAEDASGFVRSGEVEVGVVGTAVGQAELKSPGGAISVSSDRVIRIRLHIRNLSPREKVAYSGWAMKGVGFFGQSQATLKDDIGNIYRPVGFDGATPVGQIKEATIGPGGFAQDLLVFEKPDPRATKLLLILPGRALGQTADIRIEFSLADTHYDDPIAVVERSEPAPKSEAVPAPRKPMTEEEPASSSSRPEAPLADEGDHDPETHEAVPEVAQESPGWINGYSVMMGLIATFLFALYFLPTGVAFLRSHPNAASIIVINIFLGWTFLGWVAALAMSVSAVEIRATFEDREPRPRGERPRRREPR